MPISLLFEISESEIVKFADEFIRTFREIIVHENIIIVASPTCVNFILINDRINNSVKVFQWYYTE